VEEIFAEAAGSHVALQVAMRGGYDPKVDVNTLQGADRPELALLQDAEEFHLKFQGQIAYFIEKRSAAVGEFDEAALGFAGAGESTASVAEKLAFHERADKRAAIDGDKLSARSAVIEFAGGDFLARTAFTLYEHRSAAAAEFFKLTADLYDAL
jgi:hypothetical protein